MPKGACLSLGNEPLSQGLTMADQKRPRGHSPLGLKSKDPGPTYDAIRIPQEGQAGGVREASRTGSDSQVS